MAPGGPAVVGAVQLEPGKRQHPAQQHCYDYGEQWSIPPPGTTAQPRTDSAVCDNGPEWKYLYREGALGGRNIMTSSTLQTH